MDLEEQINLTNKRAHPSNKRKAVYRHVVKEQADYFAELLRSESIDFEAQVDSEHPKKPTYFGVGRADELKVDKLNFIALGLNRPKFINSAPMRWIIIGLSVIVIAIGIAGAILS